MRVLVYGGKGFVGCKVMQLLAERGAPAVAISRTAGKPAHLADAPWSNQVQWKQGQADRPDPDLLADCSALISLVGSPPVPTFSSAAFQRQIFLNGGVNKSLIEAAAKAGVKVLVLLSADIPAPLQRPGFGYYLGKQMALEAAMAFAREDASRRSSVLRASAIYGTRHTQSGWPLPLAPILHPLQWLLTSLTHGLQQNLIAAPVSVDQVAGLIVAEALDADPTHAGFRLWENAEILRWEKPA